MICSLLIMLLVMNGCAKSDDAYKQMVNLRKAIGEAKSCSFDVEVCADYEDEIYTFQMFCKINTDGGLGFEVTKPESIAGITGNFSDDYSNITFDDHVLAFKRMVDGRITPVSAPWIFLKALRSGYIQGCSETDNGIKVMLNDSYEDDAFHLYVWLNAQNVPYAAEIYWEGVRVMTLKISEFSFL